jgi:hypothetical protein
MHRENRGLARMWKCFWDWLATLPPGSAGFVGTLTGSFLGLLALLAGALFNARLNRRRDNELRDADRVALASALYAELQGLHRAYVENAQHLTDHKPDEDGGFMVPDPSVKILPEMISKIGLLRADAIRKVMDAYVLTEQYLDRLILLGGQLQTNMPEERRLVYMDAKHAGHVAEFNKITAGAIKESIDALAPYLK